MRPGLYRSGFADKLRAWSGWATRHEPPAAENLDQWRIGLNALVSLRDGTPERRKKVAVKDNITTSELPTTAASNTLAGFQSPFEATVVKLLREHGADVRAKANLDEFGMGSHSQASAAGPVLSPYERQGVPLSPGGSSGGSAVAVSTAMSWAALGTDTGGSVRLPAAYTSLVGFKPSYGLLSRWGVIQYANSLDTVGILAKEIDTVRELFDVLNKIDPQDPTSLRQSVRQRIASGRRPRTGPLRIGVPEEYNTAELAPEVRSAWTRTLIALQNEGHVLRAVSLPSTRQALSAYYVLAPAEASSNLAKYDGVRYGRRTAGPDASPHDGLPLYAQTRGELLGDEVKRRILLGAYTLSSEAIDNHFVQAQKVRRLVQRDFDRVFAMQNPLLHTTSPRGEDGGDGVDVLLTPTAPTLPPTVDEVKRQRAVESFMNDVFTVPASLAGLPALSVPIELPGDMDAPLAPDEDVPSVGMQIIGQFGDDETVLRAGAVVDQLFRVKPE